MDYQGKQQRKREGQGPSQVLSPSFPFVFREGEGPSQVLPPLFPFVFRDDDWDTKEEENKKGSDNKLEWLPRVIAPHLVASVPSEDLLMNPKRRPRDVDWVRPLDPEALDPEALNKYNQQIRESEGFDVFLYPGPSICTPVVPLTGIKESPSHYATVVNLAKLAIYKYNIEHNEAYEFIDLERVNTRLVSGSIYYITFQVKNLKAAGNGYDGTPLETFQARVWEGITETEVELCRPKPIKLRN